MTPKEKAEYLFKKHLIAIAEETMDSNGIMERNALQCALITAREIKSTLFQHHVIDYWKKVEEEIKFQLKSK